MVNSARNDNNNRSTETDIGTHNVQDLNKDYFYVLVITRDKDGEGHVVSDVVLSNNYSIYSTTDYWVDNFVRFWNNQNRINHLFQD